MEFKWKTNDFGYDNEYHLTISHKEILSAEYTESDFRLIAECKKSKKISDTLLVLEMMARRIEENANES